MKDRSLWMSIFYSIDWFGEVLKRINAIDKSFMKVCNFWYFDSLENIIIINIGIMNEWNKVRILKI
jgi:hypothetical protein